MKELSLNILDIAENSIKANATVINILIDETDSVLTITVSDNGRGMKPEIVRNVTDPFYTTRTTRSVGLGLPFLKLEAEMTGGNMSIESRHIDEFPDNHGTVVTASFMKNHIDFIPLGDVVSTITTLIQGSPEIDFVFRHTYKDSSVELDTRELRAVLGDVPLSSFEVIKWIADSLNEEYGELQNKINNSRKG